jgi:pimeloyl-ACP methyl ester carboxylesterase
VLQKRGEDKVKIAKKIAALSMMTLAVGLAGCKATSTDNSAISASDATRVDISGLSPGITDKPCPKQYPHAKCGSVKVPLNYADPKGEQLDIGFILYKAAGAKADPSRLLHVINGGPSETWLDYSEENVMAFGPLLQETAVLLIDPRGVGYSGALDCGPGINNSAVSTAPMVTGSSEMVAACAKRVGPKMVHYTSANTAHDFALITRALKYDKIDLLGFSYGSILAPTYAALHPEHIKTMILDGALPLKSKALLSEDRYAASMRMYEDMCAQTKACTLPELQAAIGTVVSELRKSSRSLARVDAAANLPADAKLDPLILAGMVDTLPEFGEVSGKNVAYQPAVGGILAAAKGNWAALDAAAVAFYKESLPDKADEDHHANGLYFSVLCNDFPKPWNRNDSAKVKNEKYSALAATAKPDAFAPFTVQEWTRRYSGFNQSNSCMLWPATAPNPSEDPAFADFTWPKSLPVLVVNGDLDKQTTIEEARKSAAQFENVRFVRVKSAPHVVMQHSQCAREHIVEFILTHTVANPDACINENPVTWIMGPAPKKK